MSVRAIKAALNTTIFCTVLALSCLAIGHMLPFPPVPQVAGKLEHFATNRDEYDTLFVGSSRTYHQVIPKVFDEVARENGLESRTFNFGIDGMFGPEDAYLCERIFELRPAKLRRVFIEIGLFHSDFARHDPESLRVEYWHDWQRTVLMYRHIFRKERKPFKWRKWRKEFEERSAQWNLFSQHLRLFVQRFANAGRGTMLVRRFVEPAPKTNWQSVLGSADDGFKELETPGGMQGGTLAEYERMFAERLKTPARRTEFDPIANASLDAVVAMVRAAGAEPVLVIAPSPSPIRFYPRGKPNVPVLDFTDVQAWPELFAKEHRVDYAHLNRVGAEIYTRALAECFLKLSR